MSLSVIYSIEPICEPTSAQDCIEWNCAMILERNQQKSTVMMNLSETYVFDGTPHPFLSSDKLLV